MVIAEDLAGSGNGLSAVLRFFETRDPLSTPADTTRQAVDRRSDRLLHVHGKRLLIIPEPGRMRIVFQRLPRSQPSPDLIWKYAGVGCGFINLLRHQAGQLVISVSVAGSAEKTDVTTRGPSY